jgi:hypothetical protein
MKQDLDLKLQVKKIRALIQEVALSKIVGLYTPSHAAIQCVQGSTHRWGTPSNVLDMTTQALTTLSRYRATWGSLYSSDKITASGIDSDPSKIFIKLSRLGPNLDGSGLGK